MVLIEQLRHQVGEEEEDLFPQVAEGLREERLAEFGKELENAAKVGPTRPRPKSPDAHPANAVPALRPRPSTGPRTSSSMCRPSDSIVISFDCGAQAEVVDARFLSPLEDPCSLRPWFPAPRGPITEALFSAFRSAPHRLTDLNVCSDDACRDDDLQLALYCCYELHYRGLPGVDDDWEWEPSLLELRGRLEALFEGQLREWLPGRGLGPATVPGALWDMTRGGGPSMSGWLLDHGDWFHAQEIAVHRSGYQLKEADPHTWGIPRLAGRAKAAMVTIQTDEYGGGIATQMHASLFADAMRTLGLDATYGTYVTWLPAATLATTNLISMFGLHRRLRGALVGHLAGFEMNSVGPMRRYATWLASLGVPAEGRRFYDVHVGADEVHQHIAVDDLVGGLLEVEPDLADEVMFGARALAMVEGIFADHVLGAWSSGRSSLRTSQDPSRNT